MWFDGQSRRQVYTSAEEAPCRRQYLWTGQGGAGQPAQCARGKLHAKIRQRVQAVEEVIGSIPIRSNHPSTTCGIGKDAGFPAGVQHLNRLSHRSGEARSPADEGVLGARRDKCLARRPAQVCHSRAVSIAAPGSGPFSDERACRPALRRRDCTVHPQARDGRNRLGYHFAPWDPHSPGSKAKLKYAGKIT